MYPKRISSSLLIYPLFWYFSQGEAYLHITINTIYPPLSYEFQLKYLWKTCNSEVWGIDGPSLLVKMKYSITKTNMYVRLFGYMEGWVQFITADIFSPTPPILLHSATTTMLLLLFPYGYRRGKFLQTSLNNLMKCMAAYVSNEEYYSIA